jgi:hypothetical protein
VLITSLCAHAAGLLALHACIQMLKPLMFFLNSQPQCSLLSVLLSKRHKLRMYYAKAGFSLPIETPTTVMSPRSCYVVFIICTNFVKLTHSSASQGRPHPCNHRNHSVLQCRRSDSHRYCGCSHPPPSPGESAGQGCSTTSVCTADGDDACPGFACSSRSAQSRHGSGGTST